MAAYKYPRYVEFRDELPMGATGKVFKRELQIAGGPRGVRKRATATGYGYELRAAGYGKISSSALPWTGLIQLSVAWSEQSGSCAPRSGTG